MKTISSVTGLITLFLFLFLNILPESALAIPKAPEPDRAGKARIVENYGKLPLSFEKNQGQTDEKVGFLSRGSGYTLFLAPDEAVLALRSPSEDEGGDRQKDALQVSRPEKQKSAKGAVIRLKFSGANTAPVISGEERLQGTSNYFMGNDPSKWRTRVSKYAKVRYREVYPGIDLVFYGDQRRLEYDFVVSPGSDPSKIRIEFQGVEEVGLNGNGDLVLRLKDGEVIQRAPVIYQEVDGRRVNVAGGYLIDHKGRVGCKVASWDRQRPLVIDPVLVYSTYLGGTDADDGLSIAVDTSGNAYITGYTESADFPTASPIQGTQAGHYDAFVTKIDASGSSLVYSTFLGGSGCDRGRGIAVDSSGCAYITGSTTSSDFPTTAGAYDTILNGQDAFITKVNAAGDNLIYSTYLGGSKSEYGYGIALDSSENAYITGVTWSPDFPTVSPIQGTFAGSHYDAFVTKINAAGSSLVYSTFLGGNQIDVGAGIAVDPNGGAYITGLTLSSDFPTASPIFGTMMGDRDAFVTKIDASGSFFSYSTYLGGNDEDYGNGIAVDTSGNAYVTGITNSTDFPTVLAFQGSYGGGHYDAFVTKINPAGNSFVYSSFWGGGGDDRGYGIAVDAGGNAYVTGWTDSSNFPTAEPIQGTFAGEKDAFVTKIDSSGSLDSSTFFGGNDSDYGRGIAVDGLGNAYVTGYTSSSDFPTVNALYPNLWGNSDAFIVKISDNPVEEPQSQLEYGDVPAKTPTAKNLVFITHGWKSDKYAWATDMANSINGTIKDRINWDVWAYDWSSGAGTFTPHEAYVNANAQGVVGRILAARNYEYIHFIAHSAGSALIDEAADWIKVIDKDSPPTIHCTFLDAYDPRGDLSTYGTSATWAEQYVDTRPVIFPGLAEEFDTTDTYLKNCFNFDVTELDEEGMDADYLSRHAWPRVFYQETIDDDSFSCGFSLSLESGISVSDFMLNKQVYPPGGNCICPICDISVPDISTHYIWEYNNPLDFYAAQYRNEIIISNTGTVTIDPSIPSQVTLTQGSPVWMSMQFEVIEPINILSLDYEFLSSSDGLLSVFFDNEVVSKIDERVAFEGTNEASSIWLGEVEPSTHVLSFRLDSFTGGQSVVKITNVRTGIMKVISTEDAIIQTLQDLLSTINNLDDGVFKNKNTVKTLTNKINAILKQVDGGLYQGALGKMVGDILSKTNGCAEGGVPDKNDWIVDCEAQNQVYPLVIKVIELLGSLS